MKKPNLLAPFACPKCGNTTHEKGISHAWIEWRVAEVLGVQDGKAVVNFMDNEGESISDNSTAGHTCQNVPNVKPDLAHMHCNACAWNWFVGDDGMLDSYYVGKK